jgi:hypothetical protein
MTLRPRAFAAVCSYRRITCSSNGRRYFVYVHTKMQAVCRTSKPAATDAGGAATPAQKTGVPLFRLGSLKTARKNQGFMAFQPIFVFRFSAGFAFSFLVGCIFN